MNDLGEFLLTTGRTLAQMALYSPDHPSVKGAVDASHRQLVALLETSPEIVLTTHEKIHRQRHADRRIAGRRGAALSCNCSRCMGCTA